MKSFIRKKQKQINKPIASSSKLMTNAERVHIKAHLAVIELRLGITKKLTPEREITLSNLHRYWNHGSFPKNTAKPGLRTPIFIDEFGTFCAVGALMASSGDESLARSINKNNQSVLVDELDSPDARVWLKNAGITKAEASLIQPGYGFYLEQVTNGASSGDKVKAIASIVCLAAVIVLAGILIRLFVRRPHPKNYKQKVTATLAGIAAFAVALVLLPRPFTALSTLTNADTSTGGTIFCSSISGEGAEWNSNPEYDSVCKRYDFKDPSKTPGWRNPCMNEETATAVCNGP